MIERVSGIYVQLKPHFLLDVEVLKKAETENLGAWALKNSVRRCAEAPRIGRWDDKGAGIEPVAQTPLVLGKVAIRNAIGPSAKSSRIRWIDATKHGSEALARLQHTDSRQVPTTDDLPHHPAQIGASPRTQP